MNQYLKAASSSFNKLKDKDYLIHPISEVDCEIVIELSEIVKKLGLKDVVQILKNYKYQKDTEIRDQLLQVNMDMTSENYDKKEGDEKEKKSPKRQILVIGDSMLMAKFIYGFRIEEDYDNNDRFTGKIVVNPTKADITNPPIYANYEIVSHDEDDFEELKMDFETKLIESGVEFLK